MEREFLLFLQDLQAKITRGGNYEVGEATLAPSSAFQEIKESWLRSLNCITLMDEAEWNRYDGC